jgi:hypothetical protein
MIKIAMSDLKNPGAPASASGADSSQDSSTHMTDIPSTRKFAGPVSPCCDGGYRHSERCSERARAKQRARYVERRLTGRLGRDVSPTAIRGGRNVPVA